MKPKVKFGIGIGIILISLSALAWMGAKETARRNPGWNWWEHEDTSKETAMSADARLNSHAIEQHITNEMEAEASFDSAITYNKGQAFLRMLEAHLGENVFRTGIRRYVKARAYSNALRTSDSFSFRKSRMA